MAKETTPNPTAHAAHALSLQWLWAAHTTVLDPVDFAPASSRPALTFAADKPSRFAPTPAPHPSHPALSLSNAVAL